jgi:ATP phosphoribosyltransferase regulatory subunit HisZ
MSSAYYGVFHAILTAAADGFIGRTKRSTSHYQLVYRSVDHRSLRSLCVDVRKSQLPAKYLQYVPSSGFGTNIKAFATAVIDLQEKRTSADYDPSFRATSSEAVAIIRTARSALHSFEKASKTRRRAFLTLLLFQPR